MAQPYIGEIRMFAGNFAPAGWMFCEGQTLPISENDALFTLIGTTYGGDGQETFNLPDLRGRIPIHQGTNQDVSFTLAEMAGVESVTLTTQQLPIHSHPIVATSSLATTRNPADAVPAQSSSVTMFINADASDPLSPQMLTPVGGSQPHSNMQPYLCVSFIISLFGLYPQPS
jgi:microcystin-dependent protein